MKKLKTLLQEFKAFITRGNVVDMAVAVIIGAAFNAIVTSLTNNILKPLINWAVGGGDGIGLITMLKPVTVLDAESGEYVIDMANSIYIDWGMFIMKIIDFLLVALVLLGVDHDDLIIIIARFANDDPGSMREKGVFDIGNQQADRIGAVRAQTFRQQTGRIIAASYLRHDTLDGALADAVSGRIAAQHSRDRGDGTLRSFGDTHQGFFFHRFDPVCLRQI